MKVLHVGEYVTGGVATYIRSLLKYQQKYIGEDNLYFLLSDLHSEKKWPIDKKNIFYYKYKRNVLNIFTAIFQIYRYIDIINPDIIHVHSTWAGLFVRSIYFIKRKQLKIVYCAHGWSFLMEITRIKKIAYSIVERLLSYNTDIIINISKFEHNYAIQSGISASKCIMIYNGVSEVESINNKNLSLGEDIEKIKLLFVGRFDRQKGIDILLELFEKYELANVELYVIGQSVISEQKFTIPNGVHQLGWINNSLIDQYYASCDAIIVPSRWEGFGLVAVEAMKNKKAVIASNRGALPEIVIDGYNGFIFDIDKKEELFELLNRLKKEKLVEMGMNGYKLYKDNFTDDLLNDKILNLYKSL